MRLFERDVLFFLIKNGKDTSESFFKAKNKETENRLIRYDEKPVVEWVLQHHKQAGAGTSIFPDSYAFFLPVKGQEGLLGIIGIEGALEAEQRSFAENVIAQIALALDRERLSEEQERSKVEIEREEIRSNLIRSISHDLRSPLTGIAGAASTLLENRASLDPEVVNKLLLDINEDTEWLIRLVENLLSLTRLDDGKLNLDKNLEAIEEIIAEAIRRVGKRASDHKISVDIPDKLILVPMDGNLIVQVIINLLDNALKYTPKGSVITVKVYEKEEAVFFEIADNGPGIPEDAITPHL